MRPVRTAVGTDADQVETLPAFPGLRCRVVLEQDKRGPVPAGESGPDVLRRLDEPGARAAAQLCIAAGAGESMIPQWIEGDGAGPGSGGIPLQPARSYTTGP